jgi:hypothetical protein
MSETPPTTLFCVNHPKRETSLRCNRCERPICPQCAVLTPTGYRCKDCVRSHQKIFETAQWTDYPIAMVIAAFLSFLGSLIVPRLGFFTLFVAPIAGVVIAEAVRLVIRRRRSNRLFLLTTGAAVIGGLPLALIALVGVLSGGIQGLLGLVWQGLYLFMIVSTVYYRLSGIQLRT